jgi:hypothetical protein
MIKLIFLIILLFLQEAVYAQDERFFRKIFSGDLQEKNIQTDNGTKTFWYSAQTPYYQLDLNQDTIPEKLVFVKRDNEDRLEIFDSISTKIFSFRFENMGINSGLYRIEQKQLGPETDILFLYYYEGSTKFVNTDSSARLYLLTIDNKDLKTIHVLKGPSFFEERSTTIGHYHQRKYSVQLQFLNKSKYKQVIVKNRGMSEVFLYAGNGKWKTFLR